MLLQVQLILVGFQFSLASELYSHIPILGGHGYLDHPFLKTIHQKKIARRSDDELTDRVCLSRWASWGSSDARRFRRSIV